MDSRDYAHRLLVPISGDPLFPLYTSTHLLVATGFARVVIGGRGPYVEFADGQVIHGALLQAEISHYYYNEWRTDDAANLKFYHQKFTVDYADYLVERWYATPFELYD